MGQRKDDSQLLAVSGPVAHYSIVHRCWTCLWFNGQQWEEDPSRQLWNSGVFRFEIMTW